MIHTSEQASPLQVWPKGPGTQEMKILGSPIGGTLVPQPLEEPKYRGTEYVTRTVLRPVLITPIAYRLFARA